MTIPSVPTDRYYKIMFFGALIALVFLIKLEVESNTDRNNVAAELNKVVDNLRSDSLDEKILKKKISKENALLKQDLINSEKNIIITNLNADSNALLKLNANLALKKYQCDRLDSRVKAYDKRNDDAEWAIEVLLIFCIALFIGGFILWMSDDDRKEKYEKLKNDIETKNIPCQSCGMNLQYDLHPFMDAKLCSECFNGENYNEPELTIEEMIIKVSQRMKEQKIPDYKIKKHIKGLKKLYRWNDDLKWKK